MSLISSTTRSHPVVKPDIALRMDFARISNLLLISLKTVDQFTAKLSSFFITTFHISHMRFNHLAVNP